MSANPARPGGGGVVSHGDLLDLLVDDHTIYALLAGRPGGQVLHGGTAPTDELELLGSSDSALGRIVLSSPVEIEDVSAGDPVAIRYRPTFATGGGFVGGFISAAGTITYDSALFIWSLLSDGSRYQAAVDPGFAAFTLFNALPVIANLGDFDLVQALVLNVGVTHARVDSGTSTTTQVVGVSFAPQTRGEVSGAIMTKTTGDTAVVCAPVFSTVAGATANFGTTRGLRCVQPAVAIFQPSSGLESLTAYRGIDFGNFTGQFAGDSVAVVYSTLAPNAGHRLIDNPGGADSDFGAGDLLDLGITQHLQDGVGGSSSYGAAGGDVIEYWDGAALILNPIVGSNLEIAWETGDRYLIGAENFGADASALRLAFDRFVIGGAGATGNQVVSFNTPAGRQPDVPGDFFDILLTHNGNLDLNALAMANLAAWAINPMGVTLSGGSLVDIATMFVQGMTTSGIGSADTAALRVTGRTHLAGALGFDEISPAALTGNVNDYQGHGIGNSQRCVLRLTTDDLGVRDITGLDAAISRDGDGHKLINTGTVDNVRLMHQNAGSAAANRFISPTGADLVLGPNEFAEVWYDPADTRWRILAHTGT